MKDKKPDWWVEFDEKFGTNWFGNDYRLPDLDQPVVKSKDVKTFIAKTIQAERDGLLDELLEKGHGGGNWRRLIMQLKKLK